MKGERRTPTIRAFLALSPGAAILEEIEEKWAPFRRKRLSVRWVPRENLHVTVRFLGDVTRQLRADVEEAIVPVASATEPFDVVLGDVGAFPRIEAPRVLWVGLGEGGHGVSRLAGAVNDALAPLGFAREKKFHPHITVGRVKAPLSPKILDQIGGTTVEPLRFTVTSIRLMRSTLAPSGAEYDVIRKFDLRGGNRLPTSVPEAST